MSSLKKDVRVVILDYPFGKPLNVTGHIVGILPGDRYNVLIEHGLHAGQIKSYKYWKLQVIKDDQQGPNC